MWKVNDDSPVISQPDDIKTPLRYHQLAMLHRCLSIEKNAFTKKNPYGILADKAGSGKTAVMISLILADKEIYKKTQNIIIVPQNIHTQWVKEFQKFAGDALKVKSFIEYSEISQLFFNNKILKQYDVLITTVVYYDMLMNILDQIGSNVRRLIFDEIDSLSNIIDNSDSKLFLQEKALENSKNKLIDNEPVVGSKSKIIWFISASFDNSVSDKGFTFRNETIPLEKLSEIMCKCEEDFIDKHNFKLIEPEKITYECNDIVDEYSNLLSVEHLDYINSLSFQNIYSQYTNTISTNSKEAIEMIISDYFTAKNRCEETIKKLSSDEFLEQEEIQKQILSLQKQKNFYEKLTDMFHDKKCESKCKEKAECINKKISEYQTENTKLAKLTKYFETIDKSSEKILIFSDFTGTFKAISKILDNHQISHTELNGGNIKSIDKTIQLYKKENCNVLMIDSSTEGCGMNLENTTSVLFVHKTSEILYNQIIGRAQRPGREGRLKIISLINQNEIV